VRLFSFLYDRVLCWSRHRHASYYLAALSFTESSFFPIPPDVMLAPMSLARPNRAWFYASLTTLASVLGGTFGYLVGHFSFELVAPLLEQTGNWERYERVHAWFSLWGFWAVFMAGFSPLPYKLFTITAGVTGMNLPLFLLASLIGRGARYFLVAGLMVWGGEAMESRLRLYIDRLGWLVILAIVAGYFLISNGVV